MSRTRTYELLAAAAAVGGVAWLARTTPRAPVPHLAATRPTRIGHRGAAGLAPENTLASFRRAVELGVDAIELDLHATADGHAAVLHDPTVDRTTDGTGPIAALTLDDLRLLDAGTAHATPDGGRPFAGRGLEIPLLEDVLGTFPDAFCVLELKTGGLRLAREVARLLARHGAEERVLVASFDDDLLGAFRAAAPGVPTGLAAGEVRELWGLSRIGLAGWWRPRGRAAQVPEHAEARHLTDSRFLQASHALGLDVHAWAVNEPAAMHRLLDAGVDGIITDFPDRLNAVLDERRQARPGADRSRNGGDDAQVVEERSERGR